MDDYYEPGLSSSSSTTLFLTGSLSTENKLKRIQRALSDPTVDSIHLVGQDFSLDRCVQSCDAGCDRDGDTCSGTDGDDTADNVNDGQAVLVALGAMFHATSSKSKLLSRQRGKFNELSTDQPIANRQWKTIQLLSCRGRVDLLLDSILTTDVCRLVVSPPPTPPARSSRNPNNQQQQQNPQSQPQDQDQRKNLLFKALRRGLVSSSCSLTALCLHDMPVLSAENIMDLAEGLNKQSNRNDTNGQCNNLIELSFYRSTFAQDAVDVLAAHIGRWASLQHLNFQNCKLTDIQCESIVDALSGRQKERRIGRSSSRISDENDSACGGWSLSPPVTRRVQDLLQSNGGIPTEIRTRPVGIMELCLDGNHCHQRGMDALARFISAPHNSLLVVDVASQIFDVDAIRAARMTAEGEESFSVVSSLDLKRLANALTSPNCRICGLQLSDNRISDDNMIALAEALQVNRSVKIVHLAWCRITPPSAKSIGKALQHNESITKLVLYECKMDDTCMSNLVCGLIKNQTLKKIDLSGKQYFTLNGLRTLEDALKHNEVIEYVSIRDPLQRNVAAASTLEEAKDGGQCMLTIEFQCDLNRGGGQRFLRATATAATILLSNRNEDTSSALSTLPSMPPAQTFMMTKNKTQIPTALWPIVLERTCKMDLPTIRDPFGGSTLQDTLLSAYRSRISSSRNKSMDDDRRKASVMFHLIRNGNIVHELLAK